MSTCTIIIKIKDYFPKIDSIPYGNFVCLFTYEDNEGQLPLISKENEKFQHEIKNITSDIKYKIHVLDFNDMSLVGMCEIVIPYNIITQIKPPNGFIQEHQKKILMDVNTKRKLFGTITNMGDIYLKIYSEIYLSDKNKSSSNIAKNCKSTTRRKKISKNNKKIDGSPKTVKKKKLILKMNSDRQVLMNFNKNNLSNCDIIKNYNSNHKNEKLDRIVNNVIKPNNSFNYKEIKLRKNNSTLREKINKQKSQDKKELSHYISKKSREKNIIINYNKEINRNNLLNRITKTESNDYRKIFKKEINKHKNIINKSNINGHSKKEKSNKLFDYNSKNEENKIATMDNLDKLDILGKQYISNSKEIKNINAKNNNLSNINNTIFSTNFTDKEYYDIDKIISEKENEIKNDFNIQFNNYNIDIAINDKNEYDINLNQMEIKNNFIKLIDFYSLLSNKLFKIHYKNISLDKKYNIYKEKLFNELKKNNLLTQKKALAEIKNFINVNIHGNLNEKFLHQMLKVKKSEFKIYQNILNFFYYEYDILKYKEQEKNKSLKEKVKTELLIIVFKNLIKNYGNISHIYMNDGIKQNLLKNCLNKYNILEKDNINYENKNEKKDDDVSDNIYTNNSSNNNTNMEVKDNKNEMDKFRVINEVDEEKEYEIDEEEKYDINMNALNNQISCNSSNSRNNISSSLFTSNKKLKSDNKSNSGQKKFDNEKIINIKNAIKNETNQIIINENIINQNLNKDIPININIPLNDNNEENKTNNENNKEIKNNENNKEIKQKKIDIEDLEDIDENIINNNEKSDAVDIIKEKEIEIDENAINNNTKNGTEEIKEKDENVLNNNENINEINKKEEIVKENKKENDEEKNQEKEVEEENMNKESINLENNNNEQIINEIITNNIDSEKEEIKSLKKEKKDNENINNNTNCNINENIKENIDEKFIIENNENYENIDDNKRIQEEDNEKEKDKEKELNNNKIYTKTRAKKEKKKKAKKEKYDEEDLLIQKYLIEEFPQKCKDENIFIRISKYEYSFGEEKIKVELDEDGNDVILKLDEGDYKLEEFIEILNEGKEEEENEDDNNNNDGNDDKDIKEEEIEEENNSINKDEVEDVNIYIKKEKNDSYYNESSEKKNKRKRRKKRVCEESEDEEENKENEIINEQDKEIKYYDKEKYDYKYNDKENINNNEISNEDNCSGKKGNKYSDSSNNYNYTRKHRRDYKF